MDGAVDWYAAQGSGFGLNIMHRVLSRRFPELEPLRVEYLGAGMDSVAFDVNDVWIFRFPMRRSVEQEHPATAP